MQISDHKINSTQYTIDHTALSVVLLGHDSELWELFLYHELFNIKHKVTYNMANTALLVRLLS